MTKKTSSTPGCIPRWISTLICLLFLIALLIVPAATSITFAEHEHDDMVTCRVTDMKECYCAVESFQLTSNTEDYSGSRTYNDLYEHKEVFSGCQICVLIHKSIFQSRFSYSANNSILVSYILLSSQDITCVDYLYSIFLTPVDLKNKMTS